MPTENRTGVVAAPAIDRGSIADRLRVPMRPSAPNRDWSLTTVAPRFMLVADEKSWRAHVALPPVS